MKKKMSEGGYTSGNPAELEGPGIQDATVTDFLLPLIGAPGVSKAASEVPAALEGLGEAGMVRLGKKMAPKMEEDLGSEITAFVKGVQKGIPGKVEDVNIYGVKGPADKLKSMFGDANPGSVPESVLREKGILPPKIDIAKPAPNSYADGGLVDEINPNDLPQPEMDWKDKLKEVMSKMMTSPAAKVAGAAMDPVGTALRTGAAAAPAIVNAELPALKEAAAPMLGLESAPPTPVSAAPAVKEPMPQAASAPAPQQAAAPAASAAPKPPAMDLLQKLTDGDGTKMQALMEHLKDQDKRAQFAQALGIIGDTLGNMGMAKAGMRPGGFETTDMLGKMNEASRKRQIDNLTQTLASDPNSQTSRMAQATLMQAMGIKPGDPREAKIRAMPAMSITQMMPQMNESIKTGLEREKNMIEARKADVASTDRNREIGVQEQNAKRAEEGANTTAAADILKNTSSLRDLIPGRGPRDVARETLERNMGTTHGVPDLGSTFNGHKVVSVRRVK